MNRKKIDSEAAGERWILLKGDDLPLRRTTLHVCSVKGRKRLLHGHTSGIMKVAGRNMVLSSIARLKKSLERSQLLLLGVCRCVSTTSKKHS